MAETLASLEITDRLELEWSTRHGWSRLTILGGPQPVSFTSSTALNEDDLVAFLLAGCTVVSGANAATFTFALEPGAHRFTWRYHVDDWIALAVVVLDDYFGDLEKQADTALPAFRLRTDHPSLARALLALVRSIQQADWFPALAPERRAVVVACESLLSAWMGAYEERTEKYTRPSRADRQES